MMVWAAPASSADSFAIAHYDVRLEPDVAGGRVVGVETISVGFADRQGGSVTLNRGALSIDPQTGKVDDLTWTTDLPDIQRTIR